MTTIPKFREQTQLVLVNSAGGRRNAWVLASGIPCDSVGRSLMRRASEAMGDLS